MYNEAAALEACPALVLNAELLYSCSVAWLLLREELTVLTAVGGAVLLSSTAIIVVGGDRLTARPTMAGAITWFWRVL